MDTSRTSQSCPETREALARLDERIKAWEKFSAAQFEMRDDSLRLQALEYERRLEGLNNEAGRIAKIQERFVGLDKYDGFRDQVLTTLAELSGRTGGMRLILGYLLTAVALLLSLLNMFGSRIK